MPTPATQARYRPAVKAAWLAHCRAAGDNPSDRAAEQTWYRAILQERAGISTTSGADANTMESLIEAFTLLASRIPDPGSRIHDPGSRIPDPASRIPHPASGIPRVDGFSTAQQNAFERLASKAYAVVCQHESTVTLSAWINARIGDATTARGQVKFDSLMCMLAVIAGDRFWLDRTAEASERRYRYLIAERLRVLGQLTGRTLDWEYVRGIHDRARLSASLDDCPAEYLRAILAMLDIAVRRARQ